MFKPLFLLNTKTPSLGTWRWSAECNKRILSIKSTGRVMGSADSDTEDWKISNLCYAETKYLAIEILYFGR